MVILTCKFSIFWNKYSHPFQLWWFNKNCFLFIHFPDHVLCLGQDLFWMYHYNRNSICILCYDPPISLQCLLPLHFLKGPRIKLIYLASWVNISGHLAFTFRAVVQTVFLSETHWVTFLKYKNHIFLRNVHTQVPVVYTITQIRFLTKSFSQFPRAINFSEICKYRSTFWKAC